MKYVCLVYLAEDKLHAVPDEECQTCGQGFRDRGLLVAAEALQPVETATTVRVRHGRVSITDGPFAETKEQLAGFYLIEAKDLKRAHPPGARHGLHVGESDDQLKTQLAGRPTTDLLSPVDTLPRTTIAASIRRMRRCR
ncbi:MAG: YciI family protein [Betaproteobacteria bacterium]